MSVVYLATLGQRPEAITMALDYLLPQYAITHAAILHTEPRHSGINYAYDMLKPVMQRDYPTLTTTFHELCFDMIG